MTEKPNATRLVGIFSEYLLALDSVRAKLGEKQSQLVKLQLGYYQLPCEEAVLNETKARSYSFQISRLFNECNLELLRHNAHMHRSIIVDGQLPLSQMINKLKLTSASSQVCSVYIEGLKSFWENIKYHVELFQNFVSRFEQDIFRKLSMMYQESHLSSSVDVSLENGDKFSKFMLDIAGYSRAIPESLDRFHNLIQSSQIHVRPNLFDVTYHTDAVLEGIDYRVQYPLLRLIPDLSVKLEQVLQLAVNWLDREETFVYELNREIRDRRMLAKEKDSRLQSAKKHHRDVVRSVKSYYLMMQNSKSKLRQVAKEIKVLEDQIKDSTLQQKKIMEEKFKNQSISEFLDISITQTRLNYNLQMKKQRLQSQIGQLEVVLSETDSALASLRRDVASRLEQHSRGLDELQSGQAAYADARADLDRYSSSLHDYQRELLQLRHSLSAMECFRTLKTSPEFIDTIINLQPESSTAGSDPNSSVAVSNFSLAPSLQNTIKLRQRRRQSDQTRQQ